MKKYLFLALAAVFTLTPFLTTFATTTTNASSGFEAVVFDSTI